GKFYISNDKKIIFQDKNNFKVEFGITDYGYSTLAPFLFDNFFKITDDKGVVYEFRDVEMTKTTLDDADMSYKQFRVFNYPSAWYLSKITSADKTERIEFSYQSCSQPHDLYIDNNLLSESRTLIRNSSHQLELPRGTFSQPAQNFIFDKKYLSHIKYKKNESTLYVVIFNLLENQREDLNDYNFPGEKIISSIELQTFGYAARTDSVGQGMIKKFNFHYGYFSNNNNDIADKSIKLWRLDSIIELDAQNTISKPYYKFEYFNPDINYYLPTVKGSIDFWGFYNGGDASSYFPLDNGNTYMSNEQVVVEKGIDRTPSLEFSRLGTLNKIIYPTTGFSMFEYELNECRNELNNGRKTIGGLRLKTLKNYSTTNNLVSQKNYYYENQSGGSSGVSTLNNVNIGFTSSKFVQEFIPKANFDGEKLPGSTVDRILVITDQGNFTTSFINDNSMGSSGQSSYNSGSGSANTSETITVSIGGHFPPNLIKGSYIGYQRVEEADIYFDKNNDAQNGKNVFNFFLEDFNNPLNGTLITKETYNNFNQLLNKTTFDYSEDKEKNDLINLQLMPSSVQTNADIICQYKFNGDTLYKWVGPSYNERTEGYCISKRSPYKVRYEITGEVYNTKIIKLNGVNQTEYNYLTDQELNYNKLIFYNEYNYPQKTIELTKNNDSLITEIKYVADLISLFKNIEPDILNSSEINFKTMNNLIKANIISSPLEKIQY
ncbi:MAG: hypothetical protein ORN85_10020, partial [Sediminibacterium sp.]|nr:hypothetical protein [Sediminibacterium sp.]